LKKASSRKKIRIVIADDHRVVREGLRVLFKHDPGMIVVGEAADGERAVALTEKYKPDIVILDISMPKLGGMGAARIIKAKLPAIRVLILTVYGEEEYLQEMIAAGADGYLLKSAEKEELFTAIRTIASGEPYFGPSISRRIVESYVKRVRTQASSLSVAQPSLTGRETEILRCIAQGLTSKAIARKLFLSVRTINTHRTNLMQKLNIHDTARLVRYAVDHGIL
jgi:DNA-binding NarL/FixJ family response regulator